MIGCYSVLSFQDTFGRGLAADLADQFGGIIGGIICDLVNRNSCFQLIEELRRFFESLVGIAAGWSASHTS